MHPTQLRLVVALVVTLACLPLLVLDLLGGHGDGSSGGALVDTATDQSSLVVSVNPSESTTTTTSAAPAATIPPPPTAAPAPTTAVATTVTPSKATRPTTTTVTKPKPKPKPKPTATTVTKPKAKATPPPTTAPAPVRKATTTTTTAPPTAAPAPPRTGSGHTSSESAYLACVRWRESHGDYTVADPSGTFMGAYQIYQGGWDATAASMGRSDLVGVRPNASSAADQDAVALAMLRQYGRSPWGGGLRRLSSNSR